MENTWLRPEAVAHPAPLETRYRAAPATDPHVAVILLAVVVQETEGADGGAVVVHDLLG
ncbi:MAG: hypothetical protein OXG30_11740 [bacterium]|nr:hypothetical protein [bacterium]MCY4135564.1 hypothetical protein [bacterium]